MMDYGLLWILAMLTSLFITAFAVTLFSSFKKRLWRCLGILAVICVLTFIFGIASLLTGLMYYNNFIIPSWLFPYATSFGLIYVIAAVVIWSKGLSAKTGTPPARAWRRGVLASSIFLGIIITLITYTLIDLNRQIEFSNVNSDLKTRLQEIWPSRPLSHLNAYPLYEQASNALTIEDSNRIFDYTKPDQNALASEIMELLSRNQQLINTLHQASNRPFHFCGSPVDTCILALFEFPRFPEYRQLAGLLGLKAKKEVLSGNSSGAFKELSVIRSMVKHMQSSSDLVSWVYLQVITKQAFDFTEYVLAHTHSVNGLFKFPMTASPSVLLSSKGMLINESSIEVQFPFLMMQNEEVIEKIIRTHNEMFESMGGAPSIVLPYILHPFPRSIWRVFIGQSYVNNVRDKWEKINKITESRYEHWRDFSKVKLLVEGIRESLVYMALERTSGWFSAYINRIIRIDVYRRLMDLAVAASAYREAEGSYPVAVEDLVPGFLETVPIDPYDGKPLKINKVHGGLDLYSVGPDPKDLEEDSRWQGPIHFYLGREAYEKYRVEPAKLKRAKEAEERIEREKKRKTKPGTILKKKRKPKRKK